MDALQEWEDRWRAAGVPEGVLRPGVSEAAVRAAIDFAPVHPDVITWFGWQDGPTEEFDAAPSGREPFGVAQAVAARDALEALEKTRGHENEFRGSWLPLLGSWTGEYIYMDLETGAMFRHDNGTWNSSFPEWNLQIADDFESLIRIYLGAWDIVQPEWDPEGGFEFDSSPAPSDLSQRHIIG